MKMKECVFVLASALMIVSTASGWGRHDFVGQGASNLWTDPANWEGMAPSEAPDDADVIVARSGNGNRALIDSTVAAQASVLTVWSAVGAQTVPDGFDMTGGTLDVGIKFVMGSNENNVPIEVNVSGGTINAPFATLGGIPGGAAPIDSDGVLNVSGGQINLAGYFQLGHGHADVNMAGEVSTGVLNMSGDGVLSMNELIVSATGNGTATVSDNASIQISGDHLDYINGHIAAGFIDGVASYNAGSDVTTISAIPEPSALVLLALGLVGLVSSRRR